MWGAHRCGLFQWWCSAGTALWSLYWQSARPHWTNRWITLTWPQEQIFMDVTGWFHLMHLCLNLYKSDLWNADLLTWVVFVVRTKHTDGKTSHIRKRVDLQSATSCSSWANLRDRRSLWRQNTVSSSWWTLLIITLTLPPPCQRLSDSARGDTSVSGCRELRARPSCTAWWEEKNGSV